MFRCYKCGAEWIAEKKRPAFKEYCDSCTSYLHCCMNCRFYDAHANNNCTITSSEWVKDKAGPNLCDDFEFATGPKQAKSEKELRQSRNAFDALFGDETGTAAGDETPDIKKLFGD